MEDLSIRLKTRADSISFNESLKKLEAQVQPITIKTRIESSTGITGLSGKSAKESSLAFIADSQLKRVDDFRTKLENLKTTGGLTSEMFTTFSGRLNTLFDNLSNGNITLKEFDKGMNTLKNDVSKASTAIKAQGQSVLDIIGKFTNWYLIAGLVTGVINSIKNLVNEVVELSLGC